MTRTVALVDSIFMALESVLKDVPVKNQNEAIKMDFFRACFRFTIKGEHGPVRTPELDSECFDKFSAVRKAAKDMLFLKHDVAIFMKQEELVPSDVAAQPQAKKRMTEKAEKVTETRDLQLVMQDVKNSELNEDQRAALSQFLVHNSKKHMGFHQTTNDLATVMFLAHP